MNLNEFTSHEPIVEAQLIWARTGNKLVRKYRCTVGQRSGRIVSKPGQCSAPIDIKKRMQLKKTKAQKGARMSRKAMRTKKFNPTSRAVQRLNK